MEFREFPSVEGGVDRRLVFSEIKWINRDKFTQTIGNGVEIHPCLNEDEPCLTRRVYVGKSIPKRPPSAEDQTGAVQFPSYFQYLEIIGNVYCIRETVDGLSRDRWILKITYNGHAFEIEDDFLVLQIEDRNSYFWSSNLDSNVLNNNFFVFCNKDVPKYALRAAFDKHEHKYNYVGRLLTEESIQSALGLNNLNTKFNLRKRPKFYSNAWIGFDDDLKQSFGKINRSYRLLFVAYKNIEIGCDCFETLCMKASPAPLKMLCRSAIRAYVNYSQKNIKSINDARRHSRPMIPNSLIDFLKYPSYLKVGEFMLKDEKLVREDDTFEVFIDSTTGNLMCRALNSNDNRLCELVAGQPNEPTIQQTDTGESENVIAHNIDNIWLHRFHAIFYNHMNSRAIKTHSIYDGDLKYKFIIEWDQTQPYWQIQLLS